MDLWKPLTQKEREDYKFYRKNKIDKINKARKEYEKFHYTKTYVCEKCNHEFDHISKEVKTNLKCNKCKKGVCNLKKPMSQKVTPELEREIALQKIENQAKLREAKRNNKTPKTKNPLVEKYGGPILYKCTHCKKGIGFTPAKLRGEVIECPKCKKGHFERC